MSPPTHSTTTWSAGLVVHTGPEIEMSSFYWFKMVKQGHVVAYKLELQPYYRMSHC